MITGQVNEFRQPIITLTVRDTNGTPHFFSATIDTGFTGFATLAPEVITALQLDFVEARPYVLGDGNSIEMRLYRSEVDWDGQDRTILVVEADDDALIGMEMLEGYTLFLDATNGGEVRIELRP